MVLVVPLGSEGGVELEQGIEISGPGQGRARAGRPQQLSAGERQDSSPPRL
jgi:hypothetical protein